MNKPRAIGYATNHPRLRRETQVIDLHHCRVLAGDIRQDRLGNLGLHFHLASFEAPPVIVESAFDFAREQDASQDVREGHAEDHDVGEG